jgi:hypothetical protein
VFFFISTFVWIDRYVPIQGIYKVVVVVCFSLASALVIFRACCCNGYIPDTDTLKIVSTYSRVSKYCKEDVQNVLIAGLVATVVRRTTIEIIDVHRFRIIFIYY